MLWRNPNFFFSVAVLLIDSLPQHRMEEKPKEKNEEWYDEVYFDSDQDSEEESPGIGLMGKQKKKPST